MRCRSVLLAASPLCPGATAAANRRPPPVPRAFAASSVPPLPVAVGATATFVLLRGTVAAPPPPSSSSVVVGPTVVGVVRRSWGRRLFLLRRRRRRPPPSPRLGTVVAPADDVGTRSSPPIVVGGARSLSPSTRLAATPVGRAGGTAIGARDNGSSPSRSGDGVIDDDDGVGPVVIVGCEEDDDDDRRSRYGFWEGPTTATSFNMDLENIAETDGARKAQDLLEVMEEMHRRRRRRREGRGGRRVALTASEEDGGGSESVTTRPGGDGDDDFIDLGGSSAAAPYVKPNAACYTTVISAWVRSPDPDGPLRAHELLERLERLSDSDPSDDPTLRPNAVSYGLVCQAHADHPSLSLSSAERAEEVLARMADRGIRPDVRVCTSVLNGWTKRSGALDCAMDRAERMLSAMEQGEYETSNSDDVDDEEGAEPPPSVRPNCVSYTTVINGWANSRRDDSAARAEATLLRMKRRGIDPDETAYASVMNAWAKCTSRAERRVAAQRARSVLDEMTSEPPPGGGGQVVGAGPVSYATCIHAIANDLDPAKRRSAEEVLRRAYELHETGGSSIRFSKPTTAVYNAAILALARSGGGPSAARDAEQLVVEMARRAERGAGEIDVAPDVRTWSGLMLAWAESCDGAASSSSAEAARNAQLALDTLEKLRSLGKTDVRPNVVCYTTVARAWGSSGLSEGPRRANILIRKMERLFDETGDASVRPNSVAYATVVRAYGRSRRKGSARRARAVVDRMERRHSTRSVNGLPDRRVFNALIDAWARSDEDGAAVEAERTLRHMERLYRGGRDECRPDAQSFQCGLQAWARRGGEGAARRAQQILDHVEGPDDVDGVTPNTVCYNAVIQAWARSGTREGPERAERILRRLEGRRDRPPSAGRSSGSVVSARPDVASYASVMNAAAHCPPGGTPDERAATFRIARDAYESLRRSDRCRPNGVAYGMYLKAISNLLPAGSERDRIAEATYRSCERDGLASDAFVRRQLRGGCTSELYDKLVGRFRRDGDRG